MRDWVEQTLHGFMEVLPLVTVALLGVQHWPEIRGGSMTLQPHPAVDLGGVLLLSSFVVLAGLPVLEELLRTLQQGTALTPALRPSDRTLRRAPGRR